MTTTAAAAPAGTEPPGRTAPAPRSPRAVRPAVNAKLAAVAVGIIAVSVAGAAALFAAVSGTSPVVVAAAPLFEGQPIAAGDLTTAAVAADPTVRSIPGSQLPGLIGQRAAADIPAGTLLAPEAVTADPLPGPGRSLVGIQVGSAQAPLAELAPGTPVRVVRVAASPGADGAGDAPRPVPAVVVSSGFAPDGARVVDVTVAGAEAEAVAGWAAAGQAAIVVDSAVDR